MALRYTSSFMSSISVEFSDQFIQDGEDLYEDYCDSTEDWDIAHLLESEKIDTGQRLINFQDYTLNSPLISDEMESFIDYLLQKPRNKLFSKGLWEKRKKWLRCIGVSPSKLKRPGLFHVEMAKALQKTGVKSPLLGKIIEQADSNSRLTHEILRSYVRGWIGVEIPFVSRSQNDDEIIKYGSYMIELLIITWVMNAATDTELENLIQEFKLKFTKNIKEDEDHNGVEFQSHTLGEVHVGYGIAYIKSWNMLLDRNMMLLFKDLVTARFHTLFAIKHRQFDKYSSDHLHSMETLYKLGDKVLEKEPKFAYDVFSMIEPITSFKLSELARQHRPKIPTFPHFQDHIKDKTTELKEKMPISGEFFDHLMSFQDKKLLLTAYGSFRHWGHPFIDYLAGLKALHDNVQKKTEIDKGYAEKLASDLAYKVLHRQFLKKHKWFIDWKLLDDKHPFKDHAKNGTWPTTQSALDYKDEWHKLPIIPCWEIPEVVDPAILYSDKTHSINRDELIDHLNNHPDSPIPTKKVLETFIEMSTTDWPAFLREINDHGLDRIYKIIGLKAKEREIKWRGRYFALMSWKLREYFVFTEYLIKKEVLPLFSGLTMADDQTTLTKKMLENTSGQGRDNYENVTIANHIDYNKWNNFQRKEATDPVFRVIGQFFGYENLFTRTHEFFEESLIYYRDRPDLMIPIGDSLVNKDPENIVCWEGQLGGLEGLRQKGWSVLNLLVIERESKIRNTKVQILAQGDNQVICTMYNIHPYKSEKELEDHITDLVRNNSIIMKRIREATQSIGLFINEDETLQSGDMLIYGKNIVYRGNITCLEEKRYSRVTCTTNDQLPGLGNIMSTVATNCLTVSHYSKSPINAMVTYNWLANFACVILHMHNPALRNSPKRLLSGDDKGLLKSTEYLISLLYMDPSLGGISGMSLTRFHIRMFPDPLTEGLAFWKIVAENSNDSKIKRIASVIGNPKAMTFQDKHFEKLLEDPNSLNLPRGLSSKNLLKEEIKRILLNNPELIGNRIVREAVNFMKDQYDEFIKFLNSVEPCFPRFLSEYKAATYLGMTESIVGLFENSKTLRSIFRKRLATIVDEAIIRCELAGIKTLLKVCQRPSVGMWKCSSSQADELRMQSWGRTVVGTTIPHPAEMMGEITYGGLECKPCRSPGVEQCGVVVLIPQGLDAPDDSRGPYPPYFGSTTEENTSLIQTWEKSTDITFLRRASNLRRVFSWFVDPSGNLGQSIYDNLLKLTGEDPGVAKKGFFRTGSALHRFGCSRVSAGGYMANSPVNGSRMIISSDKFQRLGNTNYDFMYQPCMLYAQQTAGEYFNLNHPSNTYHLHLSCLSCLREIDDRIELKTDLKYEFPDVSEILSHWKPANTEWFKTRIEIEIPEGDWSKLSVAKKSFELGNLQGYVFSDLHMSHSDSSILNGLFPIGIRDKVEGINYLKGVKSGLMRGALYTAMKRRLFYRVREVDSLVMAGYEELVKNITEFSPFLIFCQGEGIDITLNNASHRIPASYPTDKYDLGVIAKNYLMQARYGLWMQDVREGHQTWIFADFNAIELCGMLIVGHVLTSLFALTHKPKNFHQQLEELRDFATAVKTGKLDEHGKALVQRYTNIFRLNQEVRHAFKGVSIVHIDPRTDPIRFTNKVEGKIYEHRVEYSSVPSPLLEMSVPRHQNPLISGIRIPQLATGSFLKITLIVEQLDILAQGILCGGDGSGGISAYLLRKFPQALLIFNSLLDMSNVPLGGSLPRPPSAIDHMDNYVRQRCVNLTTCYEAPSDLSNNLTWEYFVKTKREFNMKIDLAVFDMEIQDENMTDKIESNIYNYIGRILTPTGVLLYKSYVQRLLSAKSCLSTIGQLFREVKLVQTDWSSSQTSEVYVYFRGFRNKIIPGYVRWEPLADYVRNLFCYRSCQKEFYRARRMLQFDITSGIPSRFLPNPIEEIFSIWMTLGKDSNSLSRWFKEFSLLMQMNPMWTAYCTMTLVFQGSLGVWTSVGSKVHIPSDNELEGLFAYYVGTWLYMSLISGDVTVNKNIQALIDDPFQVSLGSYKIRTDKDGNNEYILIWKVNEDVGTNKTIYLSRRIALIGRVIRLLTTISKTHVKKQSYVPFDRLIHIKPALNHSCIELYTGFNYPIKPSDFKIQRSTLAHKTN